MAVVQALNGIDPNIIEIVDLCRDETLANRFAVRNGLLPDVPGVGQFANRPPCTLTQNCRGVMYQTTIRNRSHYVRCNSCKRYKSLKNGGGFIGGQGNATWFSRFDILGRPNVKLSSSKILLITWCWAMEMGVKQTRKVLGTIIGQGDHTIIDWFHYISEMLANKLNNAPLMGGPNEIVEIDESYFRGRRKPAGNGVGRMLLGNLVGPARRNYGAAVDGPWIFGLVQKRQDNKLDRRFFQVMRRDANTLIPIIQRNVAPGTTIRSDEWAAYNGLGALNYIHETVNHSLFFVDPVTRVNTQRIETSWGAAKTIIMRKMRGTSRDLLPGHMAEFWWRGLNTDNAFNVILNEMRQNYPI